MSPKTVLLLSLLPALVSCGGAPGVDAAAVQAHKERMDAVQDIKFGILDTLGGGATQGVPEDLDQMLPLLQQEVAYWDQTGLADVAERARQNVELVRAVRVPAAAGQADASLDAWARVEQSCSACHDLHPEQRVKVQAPHGTHGA